jgi:prepilin-type N-terminal cleavage/methylation domain-containing protein
MNIRNKGFSLLEMIGVMAVMAIFAGALAPSVFQVIEEGYQGAEQQSLRSIGESLERYVRSSKSIPSLAAADWASAVADYASLAPQRVLTNEKQFARRLYADPQFFTTTNQAFTGYIQTQGLANAPNSPRLMVVSSLAGNITANLNTHERFTDVWEQTADALIVETKEVMIERVNLAPLFVRMVLNNANSAQTGYVLESGTEAAVAAASGGIDGSRTVYVIAGTRLGLNQSPFPGGATQRQLIVSADDSLRYQLNGSVWAWTD